jgi:N utilization substance protein A
MESKDLFLMVEAISNEKNITKECVFEALEEALAAATKKNNNIDAHVEIDRKTGEFSTFRQWMVISTPGDDTSRLYCVIIGSSTSKILLN